MGAGIAILFWAIIFIAIIVVISLIKDKKAKRGCLVIFGAILVILIGLMVTRALLNSIPSYVFVSTFGFEAAGNIKVLSGDSSTFFDSQEINLIFIAPQEAIEDICRQRTLFECSKEQASLSEDLVLTIATQNQEFKDTAAIKYYQYAGSKQGRSEVLIYNSQNKKAVFPSLEID